LNGGNAGEHWVLNPKAIAGWVTKQPRVLPPDDIAMLVDRIEVYVRDARQKML